MRNLFNKIWSRILWLVEKYPVFIAAIVIYLYYLLASLNLFQRPTEKHTFMDYVMEFDSLFFLWLAFYKFRR
jgi:hypothetical protein